MNLRGAILLSIFSLCAAAHNAEAQSGAGQPNTEYLWRRAVGGAAIAQPGVHPNFVAVALDSGSLKGYSVSGAHLWEYAAHGKLCRWFTLSRDGASYICRTNGLFIAVNNDGRELWKASLGAVLSGPAVIGWDGRVFVPAGKKIFCFAATGTPLWTYEHGTVLSAGPWLDSSGGLLLLLENGRALRLSPFGEAIVRQLPPAPQLLVSPGAAAGRGILALYGNGDVLAVDPVGGAADSAEVSLLRLPAGPIAAAAKGDSVAVLLNNGQAVLFSAASGETLWGADSHINIQRNRGENPPVNESIVIYDERGLYVLTESGATCFSGDGRRLWSTSLTNAAGIPALSESGVLYSGGSDWILYAWQAEDRILPQKKNLYGPVPEGSYGLGNPPPSRLASARLEETQVKKELDAIRGELTSGKIGINEPDRISWLMEAASVGSRPGFLYSGDNRLPINYRIQALQLLGRIGSRETIPWLALFFRREADPAVKAAAANAMGSIGMDPDGLIVQEFIAAATTGNPVRDEQTLIAIASATGALCRFSGTPMSSAGLRIFALLENPSMPPTVRRQVRREKNTLGMK
jgi:outer membrane protein assembly factor BamB